MDRKRPRHRLPESGHPIRKIAAARASPAIVSIVTHDVPVDIVEKFPGYTDIIPPPEEIVFLACGMIIECQSSANNGHYLCTLLTPANAFMHAEAVELHEIEIDVFMANGVLYEGNLLGCDFHYNLAAITIISESPLPTVTLKGIHDILSIDPTHQPFQLRPRSNLFNILPGTQIFSVCRLHAHPYNLLPGSGTFCSMFPKGSNCNELYYIEGSNYPGHDGGPVLNSFGEVIGIIFNNSSFLPSNIVSRWWSHYKSSGEFRRPFLGVEVANLHDSDLDFMSQLITRFPNISSAVVVTKVMEDSPACRSGIHTNDVIVKLDGKLVRSKLEFYETIWEKAGKAVEFNVVKDTNGEEVNLSLVIEEASPNKFYQWPHPNWKRLW